MRFWPPIGGEVFGFCNPNVTPRRKASLRTAGAECRATWSPSPKQAKNKRWLGPWLVAPALGRPKTKKNKKTKKTQGKNKKNQPTIKKSKKTQCFFVFFDCCFIFFGFSLCFFVFFVFFGFWVAQGRGH